MGINQEELQDEIKQHREKHIEELVGETLKKMLEEDIRLGDSVYVYNRVLQIISETIQKLDFKNKEIEKARRAFLDVLIDGMQSNMFTLEDEIKEARKGIKSKDKVERRKAVETLKVLERVRDKNPQTSTEERDIECESVCQHVAKIVLSKDWILKDTNYLTKAIQFDDELLITVAAMGYANLLFDKVGYALDSSYAYANEKLWGEVKRKVRLSKVDKQLKE